MPCCLSQAQAPLEQVRPLPPSGVSDRAEARVVALRLEVANTFRQKLHRTAWLTLSVLPVPGTGVLRRAQTHHCRVTRVPPPWRIGGTEHTAGTLSVAGGQPSPHRGASACAVLAWVQRASPRPLRLSRALSRRSRCCSWDIKCDATNTCACESNEVADSSKLSLSIAAAAAVKWRTPLSKGVSVSFLSGIETRARYRRAQCGPSKCNPPTQKVTNDEGVPPRQTRHQLTVHGRPCPFENICTTDCDMGVCSAATPVLTYQVQRLCGSTEVSIVCSKASAAKQKEFLSDFTTTRAIAHLAAGVAGSSPSSSVVFLCLSRSLRKTQQCAPRRQTPAAYHRHEARGAFSTCRACSVSMDGPDRLT